MSVVEDPHQQPPAGAGGAGSGVGGSAISNFCAITKGAHCVPGTDTPRLSASLPPACESTSLTQPRSTGGKTEAGVPRGGVPRTRTAGRGLDGRGPALLVWLDHGHRSQGGCSPNVLHTVAVGAWASAPQPPVPADSFAWNARKPTGPEKPSDLSTWPSIEEIGCPDGGRIKRVFPANLGQIRAPRRPGPLHPPAPQVSCGCGGARPITERGRQRAICMTKARPAARAGGAARGAPGRAQPPPRPQARSCPAKPPPRGPKIWGAGAAREPRRSAVFARGAPRGAAGLRRGTKARI